MRKKFENLDFETFCNEHGIDHKFFALRTQKNGLVQRKNKNLQKMTRTMLYKNNSPKYF